MVFLKTNLAPFCHLDEPSKGVDILGCMQGILYNKDTGRNHDMKTLITLPLKLILLPVIIILGLAVIMAKIATELSYWFFGPMTFLGVGLTIYAAIEHGFIGFVIMAVMTALCILIPAFALLTIETVESLNLRLVGFLRS